MNMYNCDLCDRYNLNRNKRTFQTSVQTAPRRGKIVSVTRDSTLDETSLQPA